MTMCNTKELVTLSLSLSAFCRGYGSYGYLSEVSLWVLYDDYTEQLCVLLPGTHYTLVPLPLAFQGGSEGGF